LGFKYSYFEIPNIKKLKKLRFDLILRIKFRSHFAIKPEALSCKLALTTTLISCTRNTFLQLKPFLLKNMSSSANNRPWKTNHPVKEPAVILFKRINTEN
jgi:hypothetical protein